MSGGAVYVPVQAGDGVSFMPGTLPAGVRRRIEELGVMNDRRLACRAARDQKGLMRLAEEYEARHMPVMAAAIRQEANEV